MKIQVAFDDEGYPVNLEEISAAIDKCTAKDDFFGAIEQFYVALQGNIYPDAIGYCELEGEKVYAYHTLGWSGNEDVIGIFVERFPFWLLLVRYDCGGHYYFDDPKKWGVEVE